MKGFETETDKIPNPPEGAEEYLMKMHKFARDLLEQPVENDGDSPHIRARPFFKEVVPRLGLTKEVIGLLKKMMVLNPKKRSTPEDLLESKELAALHARLSSKNDMSEVDEPSG